MTVRQIGGVSFQIKRDANIVCIYMTRNLINDFNSQINKMGKEIKCYISVPITGWDMKLVKTWIGQAKEELAKNGYVPVSPLDVSPCQYAPYSFHMGKDIEALLECDAVYFIRGWQTSKGCNAEFEVAKIYNKKLMFE